MTAQKEKESGAHSKTLEEVEMQLPVKETVDSESESKVGNCRQRERVLGNYWPK